MDSHSLQRCDRYRCGISAYVCGYFPDSRQFSRNVNCSDACQRCSVFRLLPERNDHMGPRDRDFRSPNGDGIFGTRKKPASISEKTETSGSMKEKKYDLVDIQIDK